MSIKHKVLIIGFGQLGKRYYESIKELENIDIYIYDPFLQDRSYVNILERLDVNFVIDLAIISTCSDVRYSIAKELILNNNVTNILFEKFLFLEKEHYSLMSELLKEHNVKAWVNCTRRLYELYEYIKDKLDAAGTDKSTVKMYVIGEDWQLCSNSIHFLDIFNYLTDIVPDNLSIKDVKIIDSKRPGFHDMHGYIYWEDNFHIICTPKTNKSNMITSKITCPEMEFALLNYENSCCLVEYNKITKECCTKSFDLPYLSQIAKYFVKDILNGKDIGLIKYDDSAKLHLKLLDLFQNEFNNNNKECKFT